MRERRADASRSIVIDIGSFSSIVKADFDCVETDVQMLNEIDVDVTQQAENFAEHVVT